MKIPYGKQHITEEDIEAVVKTLKSDFLTQGPAVSDFEEAFSKVVGSKYAVAFNNATAALHLSYKILNRDSLKKVFVTPITFASSSNCVLFENGIVEFVDIDPLTYNIDINLMEEKLRKNPTDYQGMIIVDFAGLPLNTEAFRKLADKYNLWIIEDACHAIGGSYRNSKNEIIKCGSGIYSDLTVFSFHPVKHVATGEGGMVTTNNEEVYRHLMNLRSHGIQRDEKLFLEASHGGWYHEMQELGYNYRMPDINASLGSSQIKRINSNIEKRSSIAMKYKDSFKNLPITFQKYNEENVFNAYHLFVIETDNRKILYEFLKERSVYTQVHYLPVYWHPYYQSIGFKKGLCPVAENYYTKCLSIPMFHSMTDLEQGYVVDTIKDFFSSFL
ncbi:MAG: UDP-4-amino-4,6-dideoxy-N-acetyl-beta-L-altrosamine transaminase [Bacteriovorax sp.]|nr:UDP-4-amino-4,6-dideoxy-N-acetyl-beta-L-altrosamine transaminase [Bacteriovorax sp.]